MGGFNNIYEVLDFLRNEFELELLEVTVPKIEDTTVAINSETSRVITVYKAGSKVLENMR